MKTMPLFEMVQYRLTSWFASTPELAILGLSPAVTEEIRLPPVVTDAKVTVSGA